jgi:hypothetical protein
VSGAAARPPFCKYPVRVNGGSRAPSLPPLAGASLSRATDAYFVLTGEGSGLRIDVMPLVDNGAMKVFISSLIRDLDALRDAAASGVVTLGHSAVRAEDFGAAPGSPQQACLAGVRDSDALILILGARYGQVQPSGVSATHEEYREARDTRPVLAFIQKGMEPEARQAAFIREVQGWEHGHFTSEFRDADELRDKVIRGLHDYVLSNERAPLDESELADRAKRLIPTSHPTSSADLLMAVAGGPLRAILRPAELESDELRRFLLAEALTGADAVLTPSVGTDVSVRDDAIQLIQNQGSGLVSLDEGGNVLIVQPALEHNDWRAGITSVIEEVITERITRAIRFCAGVLDHVDSAQRISHVAPVAAFRGGGHVPWRTRAEHDRSPNAATMGFGRADHVVVALSPPVRRRAALLHDTQRLAEDFTVRLRREVKR